LAVALAGVLFDHLNVSHLPWLLASLLALVVLGSLAIRDPGGIERAPPGGGFRVLLRQRVVLAFLAAAFLLQFSHAPYYGFFSLLLDQHGFSRAAIGQFWALGVVAEIGVFALAHRLLVRFSLRDILMASLLLAALRWLMIGVGARSVWILLIAQCLHAATFGSFHSAGVELVRRCFGRGHQGQGQALYSAVSFGAGGALGALLSGLVWERSPTLAFLIACAAALLGWWLVRVAVRGALVDKPGFGEFAPPPERGDN
jgi:PPP family 3-phenylpropionic acid transporter